ncbi:MAG TPA: hypothetical protein VID72_13275 [Ktedonobacterales bacterium]|jgi:hypothetical protein
MTKIVWKEDPDEHDYPAAAAYLSLLANEETLTQVVSRLQSAPVRRAKAKDILRASRLELLPADDREVAKDITKIRAGKPLSPVLLVRGELLHGIALQIADGYHRVCASYHEGENSNIPYRMADLDRAT